MALKINEIFYSIQGESLYAGVPCVFVRLSGCNLRCSYCDTGYAYTHGVLMERDEVMEMISRNSCPIVEITGGEPLVQEETPLLIASLLDTGKTVLLETNGSMRIDLVDKRCVRIVDMKCPSSGESAKNDLENLNRLSMKDQLKFVIADRDDFEFAASLVKRVSSNFPTENILFSPVWGRLAPSILADYILETKLQVRLQIQLHKILWPDRDRGV